MVPGVLYLDPHIPKRTLRISMSTLATYRLCEGISNNVSFGRVRLLVSETWPHRKSENCLKYQQLGAIWVKLAVSRIYQE